MVLNTAFVFIKPHAVTEKVKELTKETLEKRGLTIKKEGSIEAEEIDRKQLIDKHYYAIAAKATLKKPSELPVPKDKFKDQFGVEWDDMLKANKVFNAKDACEELGVDAEKLEELWGATKKAKKLIKFGGGFYCGEVEHDGKSLYVFNGFFMAMRQKFVAPGVSIYYYVVQWESPSLSWEDFRGKLLGPTDPADAPADSLRGLIAAKWKELDLKAPCNTGDNGVHASASPFESLAERMNWLGVRANNDQFGKVLMKAGVNGGLIREWSVDPQVTFGIVPITRSIFDTLEDTDSDYCAALCQMIASFQGDGGKKAKPLEQEIEKLKSELEKYKELAKAVSTIQNHVPYTPPPAPKKEKEKEPEQKKKEKAEPKAKEKASSSGKGKARKEATPEKKERGSRELFAKMGEIRDLRKKLKRDGKSKEESDEAVAPLLEELKALKKKAPPSSD
eukprot:TRINITY_DN28831_c0_g4_i2.p1 TRINITY_DN28831_c0_g4~~TRINITY_DN28831_c0_g4_i2.p1  ORF type:complete len:477 (-),score=174.16 TRINITY_DN28831_c0_g4_i2:284-1627(-)